MITRLNNFTNKSFLEYTNPNDLLFREKNILFGYNGKGKSSSAFGIKSEFLKDPAKTNKNFRVFDRDYISNSLLLENSEGKIKGIEASFGEGNVDIDNQIKKLESEIIKDSDLKDLQSIIDLSRKDLRKEIDSIHDRKKGKANIQKKSNAETIEKVIELYSADYADAKKIEKEDDKLIKIIGDDSIEKQIVQFDSLSPLKFSKPQVSDIEDIKAIYSEDFGDDVVIPVYEVVQWLEDGLKVHQEGDNCKFCGGNLDYMDVKLKISQFKENKKHKATDRLKRFKIQLQTLLKEIEAIEKNSKTYIAIVGNVLEDYFTAITSNKNDIDELIKTLQFKIDKIESEVLFDFDKLVSYCKVVESSIIDIDTIKGELLKELRTKQINLTTLVKGSIGLEISVSKIISEKLKDTISKEEVLKLKIESNKLKQQEIQDLNQQKSLTKDFADFVSNILHDINISLVVTLDTDNRNYIIKSSNEDVALSLNDISEGEKNLFSLLFFYYELFNDSKQQIIKPEIELIVVDDPISSMDDSNKFYILELMKNIFERSSQQVFVLTHSWDDFCNLSYGKKAWEDKTDKDGKETKSKYATFEIRKNNGKSELVKAKNIEKPYKYLFKEIYSFSQKDEGQATTECEIYHYPNVMRRVFEEWYSFKIGEDLNLTSAHLDRLANDFKITNDKTKTELGVLLKVCNILSHSINGSKNPQEIHQASKCLMKLIELADPLHYNKLKAV